MECLLVFLLSAGNFMVIRFIRYNRSSLKCSCSQPFLPDFCWWHILRGHQLFLFGCCPALHTFCLERHVIILPGCRHRGHRSHLKKLFLYLPFQNGQLYHILASVNAPAHDQTFRFQIRKLKYRQDLLL